MDDVTTSPAIAVEPIVGWRAWDLDDDETSGPRLYPVSASDEVWRPRLPMHATCALPRVLRRKTHEAPDPGCVCGIYAARSPASFARPRPAWPPPTVLGTVSMWGRIIEHETGWRAASAYPARLGVVCAMCAWFEPGTGVPVAVHRFGRYLYALCEVHAGGIEVPDGRRSRPADTTPGRLQARLLDAYAVDPLPLELAAELFAAPRAPEAPGYWPTIRVVHPATTPDVPSGEG
jgi:hypothetical protein